MQKAGRSIEPAGFKGGGVKPDGVFSRATDHPEAVADGILLHVGLQNQGGLSRVGGVVEPQFAQQESEPFRLLFCRTAYIPFVQLVLVRNQRGNRVVEQNDVALSVSLTGCAAAKTSLPLQGLRFAQTLLCYELLTLVYGVALCLQSKCHRVQLAFPCFPDRL